MSRFEFATGEDALERIGARRPVAFGPGVDVLAGDVVITADGREAIFVCVDACGPHRMVWLAYNGREEFRRMLANAKAANATA